MTNQSLRLWRLLALLVHVKLAKSQAYQSGERIPLIANKLTSTTTLTSVDYGFVPLCNVDPDPVRHSTAWKKAVTALHGDALYEDMALNLVAGGDAFCTTLCTVDFDKESDYTDAVSRGFAYNFELGGLPVALREEDDESVSTQYWGGIPMGRLGGHDVFNPRFNKTKETDIFVNNHFQIKVFYEPEDVDEDDGLIRIYRSVIQPFSIDHSDHDEGESQLQCGRQGFSGHAHVGYADIQQMRPQAAKGKVRYTFDIQWIETQKPFRSRWDVFLQMDNAIPAWIELVSCLLGLLILSFVLGSLYTWVMRDMSYKPIVDEGDISKEEAKEIQMWPLSTQMFFPPSHGSIHLCILCGIGAQLLASTLIFVVLFRIGVVNASQGANIITPSLMIYSISALVGGYVTARLYAVFHGDQAVAWAASILSAVIFPLLGMVVAVLTYDVFPDTQAPSFGAIAYSAPLLIVWMVVAWPMSLAGGFLGYKHGSIQNFPVSSGSQGYQDLNLQDNKKDVEDEPRFSWFTLAKQYRMTLSLLLGGILPVFSSFVSYSYAVAGPVLMGTYPDRSYLIASFVLFILVSASVATLTMYRQIRARLFGWWWMAFMTGASSGLHLFLLSMSYLLFKSDSNVDGRAVLSYTVWFAYLSLGTALMTGFAGVALCVLFNRFLYTTMANRHEG